MKVNKKVLGTLNKCYALAQVEFDGKNYLACAAEKEDPCYLYDYEGNFIEKLWDGPGGVMSLEQYPNQTYPTLLATWKFYSPIMVQIPRLYTTLEKMVNGRFIHYASFHSYIALV